MSARILLVMVCFMLVPIQKSDLTIHFRQIISKRVTVLQKKAQCQVFIRLKLSLKLNQKLCWYVGTFLPFVFPILNFSGTSVCCFQCKFYKSKEALACLKETQTFKAYQTESYKYCIIIAESNTKISKTHRLQNKMLLSLSALLSAYCDLRFLRLPQRQGIFSSWTQF